MCCIICIVLKEFIAVCIMHHSVMVVFIVKLGMAVLLGWYTYIDPAVVQPPQNTSPWWERVQVWMVVQLRSMPGLCFLTWLRSVSVSLH